MRAYCSSPGSSLSLLCCFQKTKQMPLQRQRRTALISIFSCLSCQIVLRFHLFFFFLIGSCCWSLCSSCSPCRSYQLYGLIIMLHTASQRNQEVVFFILFNGWPLRGTAWAQNDELDEKICSSIQKNEVFRRNLSKRKNSWRWRRKPIISFRNSLNRTWEVLTPPLLTTTERSWLPMKPKSGNVWKSERQESLHPGYSDWFLPHSKGGDIVALFHPLKGEIPGIELVCWSGSRLECVSGLHLLWIDVGRNLSVYIRLWRSKQIKIFHLHVTGTLDLSITCFVFLFDRMSELFLYE